MHIKIYEYEKINLRIRCVVDNSDMHTSIYLRVCTYIYIAIHNYYAYFFKDLLIKLTGHLEDYYTSSILHLDMLCNYDTKLINNMQISDLYLRIFITRLAILANHIRS